MATGLVAVIHNKATDAENSAQITVLNNNTTPVDESFYYTINGISPEHQIRYFQIIPQGVTEPTNMGLLNSYNVYFGSDQPSIDRRFYNLAIRRAAQFGGVDVVVILSDYTQLTLSDFRDAMLEIAGPKILVERLWGRVFEVRIFQKISSQLTEQGMTLSEAVSELKQRIINSGYSYG